VDRTSNSRARLFLTLEDDVFTLFVSGKNSKGFGLLLIADALFLEVTGCRYDVLSDADVIGFQQRRLAAPQSVTATPKGPRGTMAMNSFPFLSMIYRIDPARENAT